MSMENYRRFGGIVPEAASVANVMASLGITAPHTGEPWSEALLFGLGGGIAAGYFLFEYEGQDPTVYIGTRYLWHDPASFVGNVVRALGGTDIDHRTGSPAVATNHLQEQLAKGAPAIVIADAAMFRYNGLPSSWEGALAYPLVVIGLDGNKYVLDDRSSMPLQVSNKELADARNRMKKVKNAAITILPPTEPVDLQDTVRRALKQAVMRRLSPGIEVKAFANNFGLSGLHRWSDALHDAGGARGWRRTFSQDSALFSAMRALYEHVAVWSSDGTGCRSLYAAWLREAADILADERIRAAATAYEDAAASWQSFTEALLPDAIDLFARARAALLRREAVRRERGSEGINEIVQQAGLLAEMGREAATGFRLDADTREGYFVTLEKCAAEVVKQEEKALQVLTEAAGD